MTAAAIAANIIVGIIVIGSLLYTVGYFRRSLRGRSACFGCDRCETSPAPVSEKGCDSKSEPVKR